MTPRRLPLRAALDELTPPRLLTLVGSFTLVGCTAIFGISDGHYDPDPFGLGGLDGGVPETGIGAPGVDAAPEIDAEGDAAAPFDAPADVPPDAPIDAPVDAAGQPCGLLLDDLEDGDSYILRCLGRNGTWYTHNDGTTGGTQVPAPNVPFLPVTPGYQSQYSAYTKGSGFKTGGAEVGLHFVTGPSGPGTYDLSSYTGLTFWAKSTTANFTLYVNFPDKNTCPGASNCGDTYGKGKPIGTSWGLVKVSFSELGTDNPAPHPFDSAHVYAVEFHAAPNTSFEVWVDDVTLTK